MRGRAIPRCGASPDPGAKHQSRSVAVVTLLFAAALALAGDARGLDTPPIPDEIVALRVESANFSASQSSFEVVLTADIADGWHINSHQPKSSSLVPTTLTVTAPTGFEVGDIGYPAGEERAFRFAAGQTLDVYGGRVRFRIPVTVSTAFTESGASFEAKLHYQACDDTRCLRPADATRTFLVKRPADPEAPSPAISGNAAPVAAWLTRYGLGRTLALVFVMGLALNLTPCVYPLISVTIAYFGSQAQQRRSRALSLAAAYALGIALTFSMLGVGAALSGGLFGGALRQPITLIFLAGVMVALALSSFGLYSLQLPLWILRKAGGAAGGLVGALFMGLTMGVVAAPCVGPIVVGLLLVVGAKADVALGFLLFFVLALGLGAPYVALGAAAGSIPRLPRSGEWLVWVEHVFGFLLLGVALYFVSPLLPARALAWSIAALLAGAALVLGFYDTHADTVRGFALFKRTLGSLAFVAAAWIVLRPAVPVADPIAWRNFSPQALAQARAEGRPAVVDFRADWCLPCLEMEKTTFVSPAVTTRAESFAMLRADVTEVSKETEALLTSYGVLGVPTTLFFSPDGTENHRMVGYVSAAEFARMLDDTRRADAAAREPTPAES